MEMLEDLAETLKHRENRELNEKEWDSLKFVAERILCDRQNVHEYACLFRCLRNACAECPTNQNIIIRWSPLSERLVQIVRDLLEELNKHAPEEDVIIAMRCGLQFWGNLIAQNEASKMWLWDVVHESYLFTRLLDHRDEKVSSYAAFVVYNLMQSPYVQSTFDGVSDVVCALVHRLSVTDCEWSLFSLEILLQAADFMTVTYPLIKTNCRLLLLDIVAEQLSARESSLRLHATSAFEISRLFKLYAADVGGATDQKVQETCKLLTVLCCCVAAPTSDLSLSLREDFQLLVTGIGTLMSVQQLGKSGQNLLFSPVHSLSQPEPHAAHGFKAQLVRLVANLVHCSSTNQDAARQMDCIPLLLDCCQMDSTNPFITQWCILAVRNLTEGNSCNQEALAAITLREPSLVSSPLLRELGLELTSDGKLVSRNAKGKS